MPEAVWMRFAQPDTLGYTAVVLGASQVRRRQWDHRTIIPIERPEELADREFLSEEEATSLEQEAVDLAEYLLNRPPRRGRLIKQFVATR